MARNRETALAARALLGKALGVEAPCPDGMLGALASLPLPDGDGRPPDPAARGRQFDPLQDALLHRRGIEVPVMAWPAPPRRLIRISAQLYNAVADYERLADALRDLLAGVN
jgi:isopenicillin-N epimerase